MECTTGRGKRKLHMGEDGWGASGGYMNARVTKLEEQFKKGRDIADKEDAIESSIFRGVSVHVNGYTKPPASEIRILMSRHGGNYVHHYSRSKVTHTIANNLPFSKIKALKPGQLVVKPEWITDSVAAGKLLPSLAYEQYTNNRGQTNINFSSGKTPDDCSHVRQETPESSETRCNTFSGVSRVGGTNEEESRNDEKPENETDKEETDEHLSAFRPLFPNARLTPVKQKLGSSSGVPEDEQERVRSDIVTESPMSESHKTPARSRDFDTETPRATLFHPGNASTPFLARSSQDPHPGNASTPFLARSSQDPTDSQVRAWLDAPEISTQQSSVKRDDISRKHSQESEKCSTVSRKCSTVSRNSRQSMDLFDSSYDDKLDDDTQSSSLSRKRSKRRLDLIEELGTPKARRVSNDRIPELDSRPDSPNFNLHLSDSGSDVSIPLLQLEPTTHQKAGSSESLNGENNERQNPTGITHPGMTENQLRNEAESERGEDNPGVKHTNGNARDSVRAIESRDLIGGQSEGNGSAKKSPPTSRSLRAGDANFVTEFYNNSRLHHLSTWGAECRDYVTLLQSTGDTSFLGRRRLVQYLERSETDEIVQSGTTSGSLSQSERVVMHIDMDCFFVAVGLRNRPELKGKPVAVTHAKVGVEVQRTEGQNFEVERAMWMKKKYYIPTPKLKYEDIHRKLGRSKLKTVPPQTIAAETVTTNETLAKRTDTSSMSDIASCSYEARKAGVKNGMFLGRALQICPELMTIPYDFEGYSQVSRSLYDTVASYTHHLEAVSCDELFVDCTDVLKSVKCTPRQFADYLRKEIEETTGCTASAGLGPNILLSRLATRVAKPNGSYHLPSDEVADFMKRQNVKDLPGVGWSTLHRLEALGVVSCSDLQQMSLVSLRKEFGQKTGSLLSRYSWGEDDRDVKSEKIRKSVSAEINYGIRFTKHEEAHEFIRELAQEVETRLKKARTLGKAVTLKMKIRSEGAPKETSKFGGHGVCDNVSKSSAVAKATDDRDVIARECLQLYKALKIDPSDLRGLGIQLSKLVAIEEKLDKRQNTLKFQAAPKLTESDSLFTSPQTEMTSRAQRSVTSQAQKATFLAQEAMTSETQKTKTSQVQGAIASQAQRAMTSQVQGAMTSQAQKAMTSETQKTMTSQAQRAMTSQAQRAMTSGELPSSSRTTPERANLKDTAKEFLVSPSQVDPDVLNELPIPLQRQIREAMKRAGRCDVDHPGLPGPSTTPDDSLRPGCSHWSSGNDVIMADDNKAVDEAASGDRESVDGEDVAELPSFSQVDQDCLEALPVSIREEILGAYAARRSRQLQATPTKTQPPSGDQTTPTKIMALSWKPGADRSPSKSPRKKSPRKSPKKSPGKFKHPARRATKKRKSPKKTELPNPPTAASMTSSSPEIDQSEKPVALCDAVSLKDVKLLVEEWMTSCSSPEDADVQRFHSYMEELVLGRNLEQVLLLIRFIQRKMVKLPHRHMWERATNDVINRVQACVVQEYGAPLKLIT